MARLHAQLLRIDAKRAWLTQINATRRTNDHNTRRTNIFVTWNLSLTQTI